MRKHVLFVLTLAALTHAAMAQEAPPPRKMPREPVNREALQGKNTAPPPRDVQGQATIIDGEKLRIGDYDLRLFGVVPPQLSASFGPQARSALDELTANQTVTCTIRDRDREDRLLATCHNANNADLALELLRRGLAVTARGSLTSTELSASYIAAEQAAGAQKLGLWSVAVPAAAAIPEAPKTDAASPAPKTSDEKPVTIATKTESKAESRAEQNQAAVPVKPALAAPSIAKTVETPPFALSSEPGLLARYQLLITGLVMLITALGLFGAVTIQRLRERRAEMQALAAALRGELMAAHAVCRARLRSSVNIEDKDIAWPRLRSTLYQAYVGRLGWLGAELARHVASIYGQASDYAAYYVGDDEARAAAMPKRQALQNLVRHIDDILPRLAIVEHTGNSSSPGVKPPRPVAVIVPIPSSDQPSSRHPQNAAGVRESSSRATPVSPAQLWSSMQKLMRAPWERTKAVEAHDPIAEYTALIEEEMKRFSFMEENEDSEVASETSTGTWPPQKANEAF